MRTTCIELDFDNFMRTIKRRPRNANEVSEICYISFSQSPSSVSHLTFTTLKLSFVIQLEEERVILIYVLKVGHAKSAYKN